MRQARLYAVLLALVSACTPTSSELAVPKAPVAAAPPAVPEPPQTGLCKTPQYERDLYWRSHLDDVLFGNCEDFEPSFFDDLAQACAEAAPDLARALKEAADPDLSAAPPDPYGGTWRKYERRRAILFEAAKSHVSAQCMDGESRVAIDDWGRSLSERYGTAWRDVPECRPDPELFHMMREADKIAVHFEYGHVDFAYHYFALALRPHLTPMGAQYLRKFLFCSSLAKGKPKGWEKRYKSDGVRRKEYLLEPDPEDMAPADP
jgi:hypothetical protein